MDDVISEPWIPEEIKEERKVEYLDRAPDRRSNLGGERMFAYLAELDILGWKFVVRGNGEVLIETPIVAEGQPTIAVGPAYRELLIAFLALPDVEPEILTGVAANAPGLGRPA